MGLGLLLAARVSLKGFTWTLKVVPMGFGDPAEIKERQGGYNLRGTSPNPLIETISGSWIRFTSTARLGLGFRVSGFGFRV